MSTLSHTATEPHQRKHHQHRSTVEALLARPLLAHVATAGTAIRPVWFLWEDGAFWWLTGSCPRSPGILAYDLQVSLIADSCDLATGTATQVTARGTASTLPVDPDRTRRLLRRYLGDDETTWDRRFRIACLTHPEANTRLVRLAPTYLSDRNLSFTVAS